MEEFLPLLVFFAAMWGILSRVVKIAKNSGAGKPGNNANPKMRQTAAVKKNSSTGKSPAPGSGTFAGSTRTAADSHSRENAGAMAMDSRTESGAGATADHGLSTRKEPEPFSRRIEYPGSLRAVSGEGEDPCHEEQIEESRKRRQAGDNKKAAAFSNPDSGELSLGWTGNDIARGFIYGEILKRKPPLGSKATH